LPFRCLTPRGTTNAIQFGPLAAGTYQVTWNNPDNFYNDPVPTATLIVTNAPVPTPALSLTGAIVLILGVVLLALHRYRWSEGEP